MPLDFLLSIEWGKYFNRTEKMGFYLHIYKYLKDK